MDYTIKTVIKYLTSIDVAGRDNLNNIIACIKELKKMEEVVNKDILPNIIHVLDNTYVRGEQNMLLMFAAINTLNSLMEETDNNEDQDK